MIASVCNPLGCLHQLDLVCSAILGVRPPKRPVLCACDVCAEERWTHRPLYGPPIPLTEREQEANTARCARRTARLRRALH